MSCKKCLQAQHRDDITCCTYPTTYKGEFVAGFYGLYLGRLLEVVNKLKLLRVEWWNVVSRGKLEALRGEGRFLLWAGVQGFMLFRLWGAWWVGEPIHLDPFFHMATWSLSFLIDVCLFRVLGGPLYHYGQGMWPRDCEGPWNSYEWRLYHGSSRIV